jgi:hypothetical protein
MNTDTPRTDKARNETPSFCEVVSIDFARNLERENAQLKAQWKEYCGEYDAMLARWKDEKGDIAARCGYPWNINGVGLEPWCAADKLREERDQLKAELERLKGFSKWLAEELTGQIEERATSMESFLAEYEKLKGDNDPGMKLRTRKGA